MNVATVCAVTGLPAGLTAGQTTSTTHPATGLRPDADRDRPPGR
jgi:hypothetical protein